MCDILNAAAPRKSKFRCVAAFFVLFFHAPGVAAFQSDEPLFRSGVNLVLMDVSVTDSKGVPVGDLAREQFVLKENGRSREITRFEERAANVSLVVVVDNSGSMRPRSDAV